MSANRLLRRVAERVKLESQLPAEFLTPFCGPELECIYNELFVEAQNNLNEITKATNLNLQKAAIERKFSLQLEVFFILVKI